MTQLRGFSSFACTILLAVNWAHAQPFSDPNSVVFELSSPVANTQNFNPFSREARRDAGAHQAMWEPLFLLDPSTGALEPWLGLSLTSVDQKDWVLRLRPQVKWSDGKPFTAEDVRFTAQMVIDNYRQLPASEAMTFARNFILPKLGQQSAVIVVDPLTVRFILKEPNPRFALENFGSGLFSSFMIMPKHVWNKFKGSKDWPADFLFDKPIGTGPYTLDAANSNSREVHWTLDPGWWGATKTFLGPPVFRPLPQPEHLVWKYFGSEQDSIDASTKGELDAPVAYSAQGYASVMATSLGDKVGWDTSGKAWNDPCPRQLDFNVEYKVGDQPGPWTNADLRNALSLMIDREMLVTNVFGGATTPSTTMFPDYGAMRPYIDAIEAAQLGVAPKADLTAAGQLLNAAGYIKNADGKFAKDGTVLSAAITVNEDIPLDVAAATNLEMQLELAGLDIEIKGEPNPQYWGQVIPKGEYEIAYGWLACGSVAEPYTSMSRYLASKAVDLGLRTLDNTGRWRNEAAEKYSSLVEDVGKLTLDDPNLPGLVVQAYAYLAKDMPIVPLVQSPRFFVFNTAHWTGWPSAAACTQPAPAGQFSTCSVPMHDWAATHRLIFNLQRN